MKHNLKVSQTTEARHRGKPLENKKKDSMKFENS